MLYTQSEMTFPSERYLRKEQIIVKLTFFKITRSQLVLSSSNRSIYKQKTCKNPENTENLVKSQPFRLEQLSFDETKQGKIQLCFPLLCSLTFSDSVTFIDFLYHFLDLIS